MAQSPGRTRVWSPVRGRQWVARAQRGLSNSLQFAVIIPALMLTIFGMIQAGLWLHARNVAAEAVTAAADVARTYDGDVQPARHAAYRIAQVGGLTDVRLRISRGPRTVSVTMVARPPVVFDLGLGRISETATAPVERVTTP